LHENFLQAHEAEKISLLMRMNFETMRLFEFSRTERNRCVDLMLSYYRLHIPGFPELRSLPVLKTLFV
jgi:DNA repair protein RecO (recombination protein O)